jgi:hypothetical protein
MNPLSSSASTTTAQQTTAGRRHRELRAPIEPPRGVAVNGSTGRGAAAAWEELTVASPAVRAVNI